MVSRRKLLFRRVRQSKDSYDFARSHFDELCGGFDGVVSLDSAGSADLHHLADRDDTVWNSPSDTLSVIANLWHLSLPTDMKLPNFHKKAARRARDVLIGELRENHERGRFATGQLLAKLQRQQAPYEHLRDSEFQVFSQFGDDGIIQYLTHEVGIRSAERKFVEFGVESYVEANTRFLLMNDHWRGLVIDGNAEHVQRIRNSASSWKYGLTAVNAWIDRDNICDLISTAGFDGRLGILSIDIDGCDYWVLERLSVVDPVIIIVEYNSVFGSRRAVTVPYDKSFDRQTAHYSNLYWGASLGAFNHLLSARGYALVGSNMAGNNAYFVKKVRLGRLRPLSVEEAYVESQFTDSRDEAGKLSFVRGEARSREIAHMKVTDVVSTQQVTVGELEL